MTNNRIAFLGLGMMGSGMAQRLLLSKFPLTVFNRHPEKAIAFAAAGAQVAASPREAAIHADIIISMVADDHASREIWLGENGALTSVRQGTVCVECSTITVEWARELNAASARAGCEFCDAPVTGSRTHAEAGELNFVVGGAATTLEAIRPALAAMSKSVVLMGPVGSGALFKLINNFLCGVQVAALAEALAMIERSKLDRTKALTLLASGAPGSPLLQTVAARMTAPDFTPHFLLRLMAKDLRYAIREAEKHFIELRTAIAALNDFQTSVADGLGDHDISAVVEQFRG